MKNYNCSKIHIGNHVSAFDRHIYVLTHVLAFDRHIYVLTHAKDQVNVLHIPNAIILETVTDKQQLQFS